MQNKKIINLNLLLIIKNQSKMFNDENQNQTYFLSNFLVKMDQLWLLKV